MSKEITKELIRTIYDRAIEFGKAKYKEEPSYVELDYDDIRIIYVDREGDREYADVSIEDLSADLDAIITERKKKEEEARILAEEKRKKDESIRVEIEKKKRHTLYLNLKKEFEQDEQTT